MTREWKWHFDAKKLCEAGDWDAAEEIYVSVGEQTGRPSTAASAINTLVFSILIPQKRFVEARAWLQDSIDLEVTYEAWNSLENLAVCEYTAGNNDLAERYLQQMIDAEDGPLDAAKDLLKKIRSGKSAKRVAKLDLDYNDDWMSVDVSGPLDPKSTQREFYLRLIKYMSESKQVFDQSSFNQSIGASITGFANGVLNEELIDLGFTRDAAAKACLDYYNYVQRKQDPDEDPYEAGLVLWDAGKRGKALTYLRAAARAGNAHAMLLVAQGVETEFNRALSFPWYRLAAANGISEATNYHAYLDQNSWDDDDEEYDGDDYEDDDNDNEDSEDQDSDASEVKFCTNCGAAIEGFAKFCTSCGKVIK